MDEHDGLEGFEQTAGRLRGYVPAGPGHAQVRGPDLGIGCTSRRFASSLCVPTGPVDHRLQGDDHCLPVGPGVGIAERGAGADPRDDAVEALVNHGSVVHSQVADTRGAAKAPAFPEAQKVIGYRPIEDSCETVVLDENLIGLAEAELRL